MAFPVVRAMAGKAALLFFILSAFTTSAQEDPSWPGTFFKGYTRSLKGGGFRYHSPQPDVTSSLLIRSIDSTQYIEWETEPVPDGFKGQSVRFIWIFGIDANTDSHTYRLFVNDRLALAFSNPLASLLKPWKAEGTGGTSLDFRTIMLDKYNDPMGYAILNLPVSMILKGEPQRIKIVGESAGSRTWCMTFEAAVEEKTWITQDEAVIRGKEDNQYAVLVHIIRLGEPVKMEMEITPGYSRTVTLEPGYNRIPVLLAETPETVSYKALFAIPGKVPFDCVFTVQPVRPWTIYLVQHTHTDIGYTRPQTEILPEHLRYIDYALDFCDQTDSLPDNARFRWTCETSWAVREYLKTRPAGQIQRLRSRIKEGRIEVTGLFLNSSDLADETAVAASLQPIRLMRDSGLTVRAAMQDDINGVPWCLADYLPEAGVGFLNMGQNTHRAQKPFDKPTVFWWESPSGNRIMVNRPEHYMWGNNLGVLTNIETFGKNLFQHLQEICSKGYAFDRYAIQFSGYLTDNSPPSTTACRLVEQWNKTYVWPELRLATISEFPEYMRSHHAKELPVVRGAWPDWWMDGFGSAAIQTAYAREAHAGFIANEELMSLAVILGRSPNKEMLCLKDQISDDLAFYDEHTFGAAESITDPRAENSVVQLGEKEAYVWEAVKKNHLLREEVMGLVQSGFPRSGVPTITVINTLNWMRSGLVTVYIDHQMLPADKAFRILDWNNREIAIQPLFSREDGTYWSLFVEDVPAMGYKTLRIYSEDKQKKPVLGENFNGILENRYYRLTIDQIKGTISSLYDKELKIGLTDPRAKFDLAAFIYERLGKNRSQLEHLKLEEFTRNTLTGIRISRMTNGPLWQSVTITGKSPECADPEGVRCEIRLFHLEKKIEFRFSMKKLPVTDPEGVYVAFPFNLPGGHLVYEVSGGTVIPGRDQLEGSASDWNGIQNFVAIRNDSAQILFVSPEIPLVQLGDINLGRFSRIQQPATNHIYSWVLNNYWTTNFLASQEGELKWSYSITSLNDPSNLTATKFGWSNRIPFLTRVFPASGRPDSVFIPRSFFGSTLENVLMVSAKPSADLQSIILHFRETQGKTDSVTLEDVIMSAATLLPSVQAESVSEVNVLEEEIRQIWNRNANSLPIYHPTRLIFHPYESKFIRLKFPEPRRIRF